MEPDEYRVLMSYKENVAHALSAAQIEIVENGNINLLSLMAIWLLMTMILMNEEV